MITETNDPMKGLNIALNQQLLDFLWEARKEIDDVFLEELVDKNPKKILDDLGEIGWTRVKDRFGDKAIKSRPYPASTPPRDTDELRVTLILRKGILYLDIRLWGSYD
jgi:hypothetical protein